MTYLQFKTLIKTIIFLAAAILSSTGSAWEIQMDFEQGQENDISIGFDESFNSRNSSTVVKSGNFSSKLSITGGSDGWAEWGGRQFYPESLGEGDDSWFRLSMYVPDSFSFASNFAVKFLRSRVKTAQDGHLGYLDIYISSDGSMFYQNELYTTELMKLDLIAGTFKKGDTISGNQSGTRAVVTAVKTNALVYEITSGNDFERWETISNQTNAGVSARIKELTTNSVSHFPNDFKIKRNTWETFVFRIRYSASNPIIQFYKKVGTEYVMVFEDTSDYTLKKSSDLASAFLLFTYWNGNAPKSQHLYVDDIWVGSTPPPRVWLRIS